MQRRRLMMTVLVILAAAGAVMAVGTLPWASTVLAQPKPPSEDEAAPGPLPPSRGFGGQPGFGPGFPDGPRGVSPFAGVPGGAALAVQGDYVYVLRNNTLYQFAAEDLKLVKKVTLEEKAPFRPPVGGRRGPGGQRPRGPRPGGGPPRPGEQ